MYIGDMKKDKRCECSSIRVNEVVSRKEVGDGGELGAVALRVVVEFEQWYCEQLHVFGYCENLCMSQRKGRRIGENVQVSKETDWTSGVGMCDLGQRKLRSQGRRGGYVLVGGMVTRKSFLHSFGLVTCGGAYGYCLSSNRLASKNGFSILLRSRLLLFRKMPILP